MVSFDHNEHDDYIKLIMHDYICERCEEKDKTIKNNEERISEYMAYIKKQQNAQKPVKESVVQVDSPSLQNNSSNSLDKSGSNLRSCHKILLSNYIRQFRVYLDNLDEEVSEKTA